MLGVQTGRLLLCGRVSPGTLRRRIPSFHISKLPLSGLLGTRQIDPAEAKYLLELASTFQLESS